MFDWVLNTPLCLWRINKEIILHEKLYGPFLWMWFNCVKATKPLKGDSLLFITQSLGVPITYLIDLGRMKGCGWPWSHPAVLNPGLLDWETSTLTTTIIGTKYVKCKCPVFIDINPLQPSVAFLYPLCIIK